MMRPRMAAAVSFSCVVCYCIACETTTTTSDGTAPAVKPTQGPTTPAGTIPNAIAITFAPKPADTNGNLLPDTLHVTSYLFARPHPAPFFAEGSFHFSIYRMGTSGTPQLPALDPLRAWVFDAAAVNAARSVALVGPFFEFELSLLDDGGSDNLSVDSVDLVSWFEPIGTTDRVWLRGVRSVQFPKPMK